MSQEYGPKSSIDNPSGELHEHRGGSIEIVQQLEDGAIGIVGDASVAGEDYQWYPVTFGTGDAAVSGYVAGDFLSGGITIGSAAEVADGPLNLRADPIGTLETGASVTIVAGPTDDAAGTHWFEVTSGDLSGFVAGQYLSAPAA